MSATPEQQFPADTDAEGTAAPEPKVPDQKDPVPHAPKPDLPKEPGKGIPDPKKAGMAKWAIDTAERAIATYLESLVGFLIVAEKFSVSTLTAAAAAGLPAGLSVVKAGLSRFLGDRGSAAALPHRLLKRGV